jgi:ABC-2 type transport system permease protein
MGKIGLIIRREYLTRVKKKSFIILTLLGPILWAALLIVPAYLNEATDNLKQIYVVDETNLYYDIFENSSKAHFHKELHDAPLETLRTMFRDSDNVYILHISTKILEARKVTIYSKQTPNVNLTSYISVTLASELQRDLLVKNKIDKALVDEYIKPVNVTSAKIDSAKITNTDKLGKIGIGLGIFIYIFVFLYSSQVMRGVIEEKSSRVIEIIISSVKPFQLMMGKILGIAMVGLTQFLLWIILSVAVITPLSNSFLTDKHYKDISSSQQHLRIGMPTSATDQEESGETPSSKAMEYFSDLPWGLIITCFAFYFLIGYLLYASLFAAVGSAVDSETDTQQFMLPVIIPLIFSMAISGSIISNPDGPLAFWFSMIPLTSPIVMMIRLPFHVPFWQLALSMSLLLGFFVLMTWLAGRIYRTGILMYGKKTSWKELGKWLFYKG